MPRAIQKANLNPPQDNLLPRICYSTQELLTADCPSSTAAAVSTSAQSRSPSSSVPPVYSPTNPLNNSENLAVQLTHPPVIHPPMLSQDGLLSSIRESSPPVVAAAKA